MYTPGEREVAQVLRSFTYHPPAGNQAERYTRIRNAAKSLASLLIMNAPASRELSLALTSLDEVVMFANAAIARNERWDGNQMLEPLQLTFDPAREQQA